MRSEATPSQLYCRKDTTLTAEERGVFAAHLEQQKLSPNVWGLFGEWVSRSTPAESFFYLKAYQGAELVGLALLLRMKPFDLRSSYSALRDNVWLNRLAGGVSAAARSCVYLSFRNLITANLTRPFFYREPADGAPIMSALLSFLRDERDADMVTIVDTAEHDALYAEAGFRRFDSSSEAYLDATQYSDVSEYLHQHRSLKRNLRRGKDVVATSIQRGPLGSADVAAVRRCVECSVKHTRVNNPCQRFFEDNLFTTEVFRSDDYLHILVRVEGRIAGFHTYLISGSHLGGVVGGFDRECPRNSFVYERVIVSSLDYAIKNDIDRVHYSLMDNRTKLRLVESREPCGLYFFSRSALQRKVFELTYRHSDVYGLCQLETAVRS